MQRILILGLGALLALMIHAASGPMAQAQEAETNGFDRIDADGDEAIDAEEWKRFSAQLFDGIDKDGDGRASPEELDEAFETFDYNQDGVIDGHEAPLIIILGDTDEDGRVSREEFESIDWTRDSVDTDGDGSLSREEFHRAQGSIYDRADFDRSTTLGRSEYNEAPSFTLFRF